MRIKFSNIKIKTKKNSCNDHGSKWEDNNKEIDYDLEIECESKAEFLNFFNDPEVKKVLNI